MDKKPITKQEKEEKRKLNIFKLKLCGLLIVMYLISGFLSFDPAVTPSMAYTIGRAMGEALVVGLVAFLFGNLCVALAKRIDKNMNVAYATGFFLGILGLIGYLIYYAIVRNKRNQESDLSRELENPNARVKKKK